MSLLNMANEANLNGWKVFEEEEEEEDTLSFCNLTMQESMENNDLVSSSADLQSPRANSFSSAQDFFEFSHVLSSDPDDHESGYISAPDHNIIFCGKIVEEELNEYQKRDYLANNNIVKSQYSNLVKPPSYHGYPFLMSRTNEGDDPKSSNTTATNNTKSGTSSSRLSSSSSSNSSSSNHHRQVQKVNITSLTSMSAKSRRRMFMFGPVKFKPEMDLSAIKERQGKRLTTLLSPPTVLDGGKTVVNDGGKTAAGGKRSHWGVVKSTLTGRAHLSIVLARSFVFGCLPSARAAKNWIKVAN